MPLGDEYRLPRTAGIDGFKSAHRKLLYTMYQMGPAERQPAPRKSQHQGQHPAT